MANNENRNTGEPGKRRLSAPSSALGRDPAVTAAEGGRGDTVGGPGRSVSELPARFGRYRVLKKLGGGGMGTVYLVENTELEREEALKVPRFGDGDDAELRERFLREAKSAAKLDHPNLCPVYDAGVRDGIYYLTMRFLKGKLLLEYTGQAQPARKAVEIVAKLAQALESAHARGVIHRDLKPANIMLVAGVGPVVMDFGLAKQVRQVDQKLTRLGDTLGTPVYMPPEQVSGDVEQMGPASDVYSLGVILFELLTGRAPFEGTLAAIYGQKLFSEAPLLSTVKPGLSPALDGICQKAMAKASTERYASMKAFAAALIEFLRTTPALTGRGNLVPNAVDKTGIVQAPTAAPGARAGGKTAIFQSPTVAPGSSAAATVVPEKRPRPGPKPSWNRWRIAGAVAAVALLGVVGLSAINPFHRDSPPASRTRVEPPTAVVSLPVGVSAFLKPPQATRENYERVMPGMTQDQLENILGKGKLAVAADTNLPFSDSESRLAFARAAGEGKVYVWKQNDITILAGFLEDPRAGSKVEALAYFGGKKSGSSEKVQQNGALVKASREDFDRVDPGMNLTQLQRSLGTGRLATNEDYVHAKALGENTAWASAIALGRVWIWQEGDNHILGSFTGDLAAGSAVEVLFYYWGTSEYLGAQKPEHKWDVSQLNFDQLRVGMKLQELEETLGAGRLAVERDKSQIHFDSKECATNAWKKAITEGRVQIWRKQPRSAHSDTILAAFPGKPSGDAKVDVLYRKNYDLYGFSWEQRPADKWVLNKENFLKLKVGMTLRELEDIIGGGEPASSLYSGVKTPNQDRIWQKAVKEYRVYGWHQFGVNSIHIQAAFSEPPSVAAATRVEALIYRDGRWDEEKGTLSEKK